MTLSDKKKIISNFDIEYISCLDIKKAIKELKERIEKMAWVGHKYIELEHEFVFEEIDQIFGKELVE